MLFMLSSPMRWSVLSMICRAWRHTSASPAPGWVRKKVCIASRLTPVFSNGIMWSNSGAEIVRRKTGGAVLLQLLAHLAAQRAAQQALDDRGRGAGAVDRLPAAVAAAARQKHLHQRVGFEVVRGRLGCGEHAVLDGRGRQGPVFGGFYSGA